MHPSASAGVRLSAIVALAALVIFIVCPLGSIFITSFTGSENESLLVQHALDAALASENVETVVNSIVLAGLVVVLTTVMAPPSGPASFPHILGAKSLARCRAFDPLHDAALHRRDGLDSFHAKARAPRTASAARRRSYAGIFQFGRARFRHESPRASLHDNDHEECADPCARQS